MTDPLLKWGANPNISTKIEIEDEIKENALFLAANDDLNILMQLLNAGGDVNLLNQEGANLLYVAANGAIAQYLVERGLNVNLRNADDYTPLWYAIINDRADVVAVLLNAGADPNLPVHGMIPLIEAVKKNNGDIVSQLVKKGANIEALYGANSPLATAVVDNRVDAARALIQNGANVQARAHSGGSFPYPLLVYAIIFSTFAVDYILSSNRYAMAELLVEMIPHDLNARVIALPQPLTILDYMKRKPKDAANEAFIKFLIDHGAKE